MNLVFIDVSAHAERVYQERYSMARKNLVSGIILLAGALMWLAASLESDNRAGVGAFAADGDYAVTFVPVWLIG